MNTFYQIPRIRIKPFILNNEGERFFVFQGFTPTSHNKAQWGCCSCVALGVAVFLTFPNIFFCGHRLSFCRFEICSHIPPELP